MTKFAPKVINYVKKTYPGVLGSTSLSNLNSTLYRLHRQENVTVRDVMTLVERKFASAGKYLSIAERKAFEKELEKILR